MEKKRYTSVLVVKSQLFVCILSGNLVFAGVTAFFLLGLCEDCVFLCEDCVFETFVRGLRFFIGSCCVVVDMGIVSLF